MARSARGEFEGAIYHVTQRGNGGQVIFGADDERRFFLTQLETTAERHDWLCLAYCLMSNHYHLVIETKGPSLGDGMRRLGTVHAQTFNRRRVTYGHVYQERYGGVVVRTDRQFAQLLPYVALNPVAAGLCRDPASWPWSSHCSMLEQDTDPTAGRARVEELLGDWGGPPGTRYAKLFAALDVRASQLADREDGLHRPALRALLSLTPRDQAIRAALDYGYHQSEVADVLGVSQSTISRWLRRWDNERD
jgi:REP element-mobilizing transposase RayT